MNTASSVGDWTPAFKTISKIAVLDKAIASRQVGMVEIYIAVGLNSIGGGSVVSLKVVFGILGDVEVVKHSVARVLSLDIV